MGSNPTLSAILFLDYWLQVLFSRLYLFYNAGRIAAEDAMQLDRVEVSWDEAKSNWVVRMEMGGEVIRRHCSLPKNADEQALRSAAQQVAKDEGYEADLVKITVRH